jgi:hypothetical protein
MIFPLRVLAAVAKLIFVGNNRPDLFPHPGFQIIHFSLPLSG